MKKILLISIIALAGLSMKGQQMPLYSHYVLNYLQINPAVAGSQPCLDMKIGYRRQWMGIGEGPRTAFGNIHGSFGKKKHNFHGVGGQVFTDDTGAIGFTGMNGVYAYHMKMNRKYYLSAGIGVGFMQYRIDLGGIVLPDVQVVNDPAFAGSSSEFLFPQIQFGLWLYKEDRFYGFAIHNLTENALSILPGSAMRRHYSFAAGRAIEMQDGFMFKPSAHLQYVASSRASIDLTAMFDYKEKVQVGVGFRSESGITGLLRVDLFRYVTLGYAYDFALSRIRFDGRHTHEVVLGIQACAGNEGRAVPCAAYQ
ncbi:MAG: type IX secretion system membrane protein PorP/SprF [Flavobacteriales bacterium]|nr:type IX secretion system membrane protein PorP/SprF [Flavobacteriales bacterium]